MRYLDLVGGVARGGRECCARRASSPFAGGVTPPPLRVVTRVVIPVVIRVVSCRLLWGVSDSGFGFRVSGAGFRVPGSEFQVLSLGFRISVFGIWDSASRMSSSPSLWSSYRGLG